MEDLNLNFLANIIILIFAIYHIGVGIPTVLSFSVLRKVGERLYALNIPETVDPKYEYSLKPLGFYALTLGFVCIAELFNSNSKQKAIFLLILSFLLLSRAWGRFFYKELVEKAFDLPWKRSQANVLFNIASAIILIALSFRLYFY